MSQTHPLCLDLLYCLYNLCYPPGLAGNKHSQGLFKKFLIFENCILRLDRLYGTRGRAPQVTTFDFLIFEVGNFHSY